jgi:hypothetical protein
MGQQPLVVQVLLIIDASLSHSHTPHSVGLLWKSDQTDVETWTWQHTTLKTDISASGGIRTRNSSRRSKAWFLDREGSGIGVGHLHRPEMQVCRRRFLEVSCGTKVLDTELLRAALRTIWKGCSKDYTRGLLYINYEGFIYLYKLYIYLFILRFKGEAVARDVASCGMDSE